jgi:hypothetical protein
VIKGEEENTFYDAAVWSLVIKGEEAGAEKYLGSPWKQQQVEMMAGARFIFNIWPRVD